MLGDDLADWGEAVLRRVDGDEIRRMLMVDRRPPAEVMFPVDGETLETFRLDSWENGRPVYVSVRFVQRGSR